MLAKFNLSQSSTEDDRPPISYKVREYFEQFITAEVLEQKNIIVKNRWNIVLAVYFVRKGKYGPDAVCLAKGVRTVGAENTRIYEVLIPMQAIDAASDKYIKTIELLYEAITLFLTSIYKKVTKEFMNQIWEKVDKSYLLLLPYPAEFEEQKYLLDEEQERQRR